MYNSEAQQFTLDNLDAIIAINAEPSRENQGRPWTPEDDEHLRQAVQSGVDIHDICAGFKRTRGAIDSRLKKFGLAKS